MSDRDRKPPPQPGPVDPTTRTKLIPPRALLRLRDHELVALSGPDAGRSWKLARDTVVVGQDPACDVALSDPAVSRRHLSIEETPEGCMLSDPGSRNGTLVNGMRVKEAYLFPGSIIELGDTRLKIQRVQVEARTGIAGLVGASAPMRALFTQLERVAATNLAVVLSGETGTGKELVARAIHTQSSRAERPYVVLDCASTEPTLMAAAMFGHTAGAFTGATGARSGAFVSASGGTLFIDEVGELPLELQPKLLRVLETKEVQAVGSDVPVKVDVRIISATHRSLDEMVAQGRFRQDLYYRLAGLVIEVPALRDRRDDVLVLARHFLGVVNPALSLGPSAMTALGVHDWPGNVRELKNVLERSAALATGSTLEAADLVFGRSARSAGGPGSSGTVPVLSPSPGLSGAPGARSLEEVEREAVATALASSGWNKVEASRLLGITRKTLDAKIEKYGLKRP